MGPTGDNIDSASRNPPQAQTRAYTGILVSLPINTVGRCPSRKLDDRLSQHLLAAFA